MGRDQVLSLYNPEHEVALPDHRRQPENFQEMQLPLKATMGRKRLTQGRSEGNDLFTFSEPLLVANPRECSPTNLAQAWKPPTQDHMIISSGLGFLVAVIVFGCSLVFNLVFDAWRGAGYYDTHKWPFAASLLLSAVMCWFLGCALRRRASQVVIDKVTGQEMVLDRGNHTLFFIPMHLWGPVLAVIGAVVLVQDLLK